VADFIGESNILNGTMICDKRVEFCDQEFDCVDAGFGENTPVDVVIRPEDIYIWENIDRGEAAQSRKTASLKVESNGTADAVRSETASLLDEDVDPEDRVPKGKFTKWYGTVESCIFKGVHYEMIVSTENGYEFMVQDYHEFLPGTEVGMLVKPEDIQVMHKERLWNAFEGEMLEGGKVRFLDEDWDVSDNMAEKFSAGDKVEVRVAFERVTLLDHEDDGVLSGDVHFILYKGDHYHLTIRTDDGDDIYVDTNDVWDDGDRVGIQIAPSSIRLVKAE
jgi:spermidine/putrescine transport system ATP-binding protein